MSKTFQRVAVLGPGLMGGSLLMALRRKMPRVQLSAWARRAGALEDLQKRGLANDVSVDPVAAVAGADVVILCVPVEKMAELAARISDAVNPNALVTDVGSVKAPVIRELEKIFALHGNFVGSHPMCGSEAAGIEAARADLYEGAVCAVTPGSHARPEMVGAAKEFWQALGASVIELSPGDHDRAAALVSHVPHVAASALVETLCGDDPDFRKMCAGGFRDTTRVASGSPELWTGILSLNREEVARGIDELVGTLQKLQEALKRNDTAFVLELLRSAAAHRAQIVKDSTK